MRYENIRSIGEVGSDSYRNCIVSVFCLRLHFSFISFIKVSCLYLKKWSFLLITDCISIIDNSIHRIWKSLMQKCLSVKSRVSVINQPIFEKIITSMQLEEFKSQGNTKSIYSMDRRKKNS